MSVDVTSNGKKWVTTIQLAGVPVPFEARTMRGLQRKIKRFRHLQDAVASHGCHLAPQSTAGQTELNERLVKWQDRLLRDANTLLQEPRKATIARRSDWQMEFHTGRPYRYF